MNTDRLRDDMFIAVHNIETAAAQIINAMQALEREHAVGCDVTGAARTALDTITTYWSILEGVDNRLRGHAQGAGE